VDVGFDKKNEYRIRIGQSKVPFGFENMQSSQNRLPLDRNDALNSAVANERDLAAFFYWAPTKIRKRFTHLVNDNLKGSGDYGVVGFGVFNGQTANKPELNNGMHIVGRLTYPFQIGSQTFEPSVQAYTGKYVMAADQLSTGIKTTWNKSYLDERAAVSLILYPQPFGIQAEYNMGKGPQFNAADSSVKTKDLNGGYVTFSYFLKYKSHAIFPFVRMQYYDGGKKHELDARSYTVNEYEAGIEWQPNKNFELVCMYTMSKRRFEDLKTPKNTQEGSLLRIQAQVNF
jgi:phosphate-selective porin